MSTRGSNRTVPPPKIRIAPTGGTPTSPRLSHTVPAPRLELTVLKDGGVANRSVVIDGDLVRIGALEGNDLVLEDRQVSRFHCRLTRDNAAWKITDTDSLNGTRINGLSIRDADLPLPECILTGDRKSTRLNSSH